MTHHASSRHFLLGQTVISANALERLHPEDVYTSLARHARGDWGECDPEDAAENELALKEGHRLLSVYRDRQGTRFWIITESTRDVTTILLPEKPYGRQWGVHPIGGSVARSICASGVWFRGAERHAGSDQRREDKAGQGTAAGFTGFIGADARRYSNNLAR